MKPFNEGYQAFLDGNLMVTWVIPTKLIQKITGIGKWVLTKPILKTRSW
jgi:hypothetical protein